MYKTDKSQEVALVMHLYRFYNLLTDILSRKLSVFTNKRTERNLSGFVKV